MSSSQKIFDEFPTVDCNQCERYYTNQCDGVKPSSEAQKRVCNSFLATRRVIIPEQIKMLQEEILWLKVFIISSTVISGLVLTLYVFG